LVNLLHGLICFFDFLGDFFGFFLQSFKGLDKLIVLKDITFGLVEFVQELVFQLPQLHSELALELYDVVPLLVDFWSFFLQEYV